MLTVGNRSHKQRHRGRVTVEYELVAGVLDHAPEDWDNVIETNLNACFLLSKLAAQSMVKQRQGKIINIPAAEFCGSSHDVSEKLTPPTPLRTCRIRSRRQNSSVLSCRVFS
jgi:hypothetical protein